MFNYLKIKAMNKIKGNTALKNETDENVNLSVVKNEDEEQLTSFEKIELKAQQIIDLSEQLKDYRFKKSDFLNFQFSDSSFITIADNNNHKVTTKNDRVIKKFFDILIFEFDNKINELETELKKLAF